MFFYRLAGFLASVLKVTEFHKCIRLLSLLVDTFYQ